MRCPECSEELTPAPMHPMYYYDQCKVNWNICTAQEMFEIAKNVPALTELLGNPELAAKLMEEMRKRQP